MHNSELLSMLDLASDDLFELSENLMAAAEELQRRGEKQVARNDKKRISKAPMEYLEADALAWDADLLEQIACRVTAIYKRLDNTLDCGQKKKNNTKFKQH